MPEDLVRQIEPLHELVRAHGWPLLMVEGVEADDVIGTLATQAVAAGIDCVISTSDKDLAQLVRPGIKLVNTMSNETLDEPGVVAKFGVRADQVLDLLALTGDAVDNVPGVAKVGPKTAAKWLAQFGTLDEVIAHAGEIPGVVGDNLRATLDWLPQGKRLLTVKTDCALPLSPTDLRFGPADADRLRPLFERYEFKSWLRDGKGRGSSGDAATAIADRAARQNTRNFSAAQVRDEQPAGDPPPAVPRHYETVQDEAALRTLAVRDRAGGARLLRYRDDRTRPDARADRRAVPGDRAGPRLLHPAGAPLSGCRRSTSPGRHARALRALVCGPVAKEAGPERQVRPARARESRLAARRRCARHAAGVLRARGAPAARHGQPRVAAPERQDDRLCGGRRKGREADRLRPGEHCGRDGLFGGGCRHHAAAAPLPPSARRRRPQARPRLHDDRDAGAPDPVRDGARRRDARHGAPRGAKRRARRQGDGIGGPGLSARRAAVQPRIAEAAGRDPVRQDEAADACARRRPASRRRTRKC